MGNIQSIDPTHIRIYKNLLQVSSLSKRQELLETLMSGQEYIVSAKRAGVYGELLSYLGTLRNGRSPTGLLPGEAREQPTVATVTPSRPRNELVIQQPKAPGDPMKIVAKQKNSQKALSFFTTCLRVLELQEEIALTEEALKKAYKKKAITAHPDKGGSEEQFESITRAYAYLNEILKLVKGQRTKEGEQQALPSVENVRSSRSDAASSFAQVEPVRLNPKKLDLNAFNTMFEATRIPDPEDDGYGDWLKDATASSSSSSSFGGKFNRNVFNKMFEDESRKNTATSQAISIMNPQSLMMAPSLGIELGRERPQTYTAPANAELNYTDLRQAYTTGSTFSGEVAGISVASRSLEGYKASREKVSVLSDSEKQAIEDYERTTHEAETRRQLRAANEHIVADQYHERMKRLVIRD